MSKDLKEALVRVNRIIDHWERQELDSNEAMEMICPLLATITAHMERVLDPAAGSKEEKEDEAASHLPEKEKEKEELQDSEPEPGDLFSKTEDDLETKDESKSSKKKPKEFAGSNGEIPF